MRCEQAVLQGLDFPDVGRFPEGFYSRCCNLMRPLATYRLLGCREYFFSEFSALYVLQALCSPPWRQSLHYTPRHPKQAVAKRKYDKVASYLL